MSEIKFKERFMDDVNQYVQKSDAEIDNLARGIVTRQVIGDWMVPDHIKSLVFTPLLLLNAIEIKTFKRDGVVHFCGIVADSILDSVDGYPMFLTLLELDRTDWEKLMERVNDY